MSAQRSDFTPSTRFGVITGQRFLLLLLSAFALVFSVNGLLIYKAISTFDGIEVDDAYQRGRAYNQTIDAMAVQNARGWQAAIEVAPSALDKHALHAAHVVVVLKDRAGTPLDKLRLQATFWRPVSVGVDQSLHMSETAPGRYESDFRLAAGGNWVLRLAALGPKGEKFAQEERVMIRN
jgi:nitrogen fixation protein FixH